MFVMTHGSGSDAYSPWMNAVSEQLEAGGVQVARFQFDYMQRILERGTRQPPPRAPVLMAQWQRELADVKHSCVIGGKSLGGRMATMIMADNPPPQVRGVVCLGYPYHPARKTEKTRIEHLADVKVPMLVVQGTRDPMGSQFDVDQYDLPKNIQHVWLPDGDHDFKPRQSSGVTLEQNLTQACDRVADFIACCLRAS